MVRIQVPQPSVPVFSGASPLARKSATLAGVRRRHPVFLPCRTRVEALIGAVWGAGLCGAFWNLRAALEPRSRDRVLFAWRPVRSCNTPFPSAAAQASGCDPAAQTGTVVCCVWLPQVSADPGCSVNAELLFLFGPAVRQGAGERCDREVRGRRSVGDRLDDEGGQIGEGSKIPDVPLDLALAYGDLLAGAHAPLDEIVHPASRPRDGGGPGLSDRDLVAIHVARIVLRPRHIEVTILVPDPASHQLAEADDDSRADMPDERADGRSQSASLLTIPWVPVGAKARKGIAFEPAGDQSLDSVAATLLTAIARARCWMDDLVEGR